MTTEFRYKGKHYVSILRDKGSICCKGCAFDIGDNSTCAFPNEILEFRCKLNEIFVELTPEFELDGKRYKGIYTLTPHCKDCAIYKEDSTLYKETCPLPVELGTCNGYEIMVEIPNASPSLSEDIISKDPTVNIKPLTESDLHSLYIVIRRYLAGKENECRIFHISYHRTIEGAQKVLNTLIEKSSTGTSFEFTNIIKDDSGNTYLEYDILKVKFCD